LVGVRFPNFEEAASCNRESASQAAQTVLEDLAWWPKALAAARQKAS
jgi:hypothetical protein